MKQREHNLTLPSAEKVEMEAARWLAKLDKLYDDHDYNFDDYANQNEDFATWINGPIANRVALLRLLSVWKRTGRMSALKSPHFGISDKKQKMKKPNYKIIVTGLAAACVLLIFSVVSISQKDTYTEKTYQTAKGGHEVAPLIDGSKVELNSDTKFTVQMTEKGRVVILDHGEAFFEVSRDENRPFRIIAGDHTVTVLGTKFSVYRNAGEIEVAVTEGKVEIDEATSLSRASSTIILPGDIAKTERGTVLVLNKGLDIVERELSWRHGYIVLDKKTLKEATKEFSRYHDVEFLIQDQVVSEILVSGRFKLDNLEGFLRLLEEGFGFNVSRSDNKISISS